MGGYNSKIPSPHPGQMLKFIGLPEYNDFFEKLEEEVKQIDHIRTEIDLRFTDFIRSLGVDRIWEKYPEFDQMIGILLIVLVVNGKGGLTNIVYSN